MCQIWEGAIFLKHIPTSRLIIFGTHNLQAFKHSTLINELPLIQFYLKICPKLHHQKWWKLHVTLPINKRNMHVLLSVCSLKDDNIITSKPTWKLKHTNSIPLGVHSAKCRHQSPEWTILSHVDCFFHGEVVRFQVLLDSLIHIVRGRPGGLLQFSKEEAVKILASVGRDAVLGQ